MGRDTAACIALVSMGIEAAEEDILFFVPADHYIGDLEQYQSDIKKAQKHVAENDGMLLFGIKPTEPSQNYGYIQVGSGSQGISPVVSFKEKPPEAVAKTYLQAGHFYWNSGMFFFKKQFILAAFKKHSRSILIRWKNI